MMKYTSDNPITNFLLASCLLLTLIVAAQWMLPYEVDTTTSASSDIRVDDEIPGSAESQYVHPHISNFAEILERPIFFSKREMPVAKVAKAPAQNTPMRLRLEGIAISADHRVAVLRDQGNNQLVKLSVGMTHNDWLLEDLTSAHAIFRRDDDIAELTLDIENR